MGFLSFSRWITDSARAVKTGKIVVHEKLNEAAATNPETSRPPESSGEFRNGQVLSDHTVLTTLVSALVESNRRWQIVVFPAQGDGAEQPTVEAGVDRSAAEDSSPDGQGARLGEPSGADRVRRHRVLVWQRIRRCSAVAK